MNAILVGINWKKTWRDGWMRHLFLMEMQVVWLYLDAEGPSQAPFILPHGSGTVRLVTGLNTLLLLRGRLLGCLPVSVLRFSALGLSPSGHVRPPAGPPAFTHVLHSPSMPLIGIVVVSLGVTQDQRPSKGERESDKQKKTKQIIILPVETFALFRWQNQQKCFD